MDRYFRETVNTEGNGASSPNKAWLFAQAILGKPIPNPYRAQADARAKREQLEWLASISYRHADELRRLQSAEAEARRQREELEWAAQISTRAQEQLRALQQREAREREAWQALEQFYQADAVITEWNEVDHPRAPKGSHTGGQWVDKGGGGGSGGTATSAGALDRADSGGERDASAARVPPRMLELAGSWWKAKDKLVQYRRDIERLPAHIASVRAQLRLGGRPAPVHAHNLAKAEQDLATAKAQAPELETQLRDLEREYRESGFDDIDYGAFTTGETHVGGRGIEQVGRAVHMRGSPAGITPTGIETEIALGAPVVRQLGKAALNKALTKSPSNAAKEVYLDFERFPRSAQHLDDAGALNRPLSVNRGGAAANRAEALRAQSKVPGMDLDEAPPAVLRQPGDPVSVRPIPPADNRGAGASIGNQLRSVPSGKQVIIRRKPGGR